MLEKAILVCNYLEYNSVINFATKAADKVCQKHRYTVEKMKKWYEKAIENLCIKLLEGKELRKLTNPLNHKPPLKDVEIK